MNYQKSCLKVVILYSVMLFYSAKASGSNCKTVCFGGKYCEVDRCLPCKTGTYRSENAHSETFCIKWTNRTGQFEKIIHNGSSTLDIVWGCFDGYEIRNINAAGEWECVKSITSTVTMAIQSTVTTTAIPNTTVTTEQTGAMVESHILETKYIIAIVVSPVILILIIIVAVILRKMSLTKCDRQLNELSTLLVLVLGAKEFPQFILHLKDPSSKFDRDQNMETSKKCIKVLQNWKSLNPEIIRAEYIVNALDEVGCKLDSDINKTDIRQVINYLEKLKNLNIEFKKFCNTLCDKLGNDSETLAIELGLHQEFDNRKREMNSIQLAFSATLVKWSLSYPYTQIPNTGWHPLTTIRNVLQKLERTDVVQEFPEQAKNVYNFLGINDFPNGQDLHNEAEETLLKHPVS